MNERYICPRCGYKTDRKAYLKRHLQRKRICPTTLRNICINEIYIAHFGDDLTELYAKQVQTAICNISENKCEFCGKTFSRKASVKRHIETTCLKNSLFNQTNIKYKKNDETLIICETNTIEQSIDEKNSASIQKQKEEIDVNIKNNKGYLYLIKLYNLNTSSFEYKFGKTNRYPMERLKEHGHCTEILFLIKVDNTHIESDIIVKLNNSEDIQNTHGREYFECNDDFIILDVIMKNIY
jgi:hypothetical protein